MNFLAHAWLAGESPALVVGGVFGDWVKGPLPGTLPADLARGVALRRAIDAFAETHPAFRASRARVSSARRRYAGVLVDIFWDHLLARDWALHAEGPLAPYCAGVYRQLAARRADLPASAHLALERMAREDWLGSYAGLEASRTCSRAWAGGRASPTRSRARRWSSWLIRRASRRTSPTGCRMPGASSRSG